MKNLLTLFFILVIPLGLKAQDSPSQLNVDLSSGTSTNTFFISLKGGLSYLTASVKDDKDALKESGVASSDVDQFYKDFRIGYHAKASAGLFFTERIGAGISYRYFTTKASMVTFLDPMYADYRSYGEISDKVQLNFVGATFIANYNLDEKWKLNATYAMGYSFLHEEVLMIEQAVLATGGTLGLDLAIETAYKITPKLSANLQLGLFVTNFKKVKMDDGWTKETIELSDDEYLNYSALDLSAGITYTF